MYKKKDEKEEEKGGKGGGKERRGEGEKILRGEIKKRIEFPMGILK